MKVYFLYSRTNQLINDKSYIDIPNWGIQSSLSFWCTDRDFGSATGLQLCIDSSYPNVTHRINPLALLVGRSKWICVLRPINEKVKFYELGVKASFEEKKKNVDVSLSANGDKDVSKLSFNFDVEQMKDGSKTEIRSETFPEFFVAFSSMHLEKNQSTEQIMNAVLKLNTNFQYKLHLSQEEKTEMLPDLSLTSDGIDTEQTILSSVDEQTLILESVSNVCKWNKKNITQGESAKTDIILSYENLNSEQRWLTSVLPKSFWENDSKAWLRMEMLWKSPVWNEAGVKRETEFHIKLPGSTSELIAASLESGENTQIIFDLKELETSSNKLLSFAHLSYDDWTSSNETIGKQTRLVNLTVSQRSWSVKYEVGSTRDDFTFIATLQRNIMSPKNDESTKYIGWWNEEQSANFDLEESEITLSLQVTDDYSSKKTAKLIKANLTYPFYEKKEAVLFDGRFIYPYPEFWLNFLLQSSYHNLNIASESYLNIENNNLFANHSTSLTHLPTQTKACNTFELTEKKLEEQKGWKTKFNHDIKSHVFDLSTRLKKWCHSADPKLYTLLLNITTNSSSWDMLNTRLDQIVEDINTDYSNETCHFQHPLMTIDVEAEWTDKGKYHKKNARFCNLNQDCTELLLEVKDTGNYFVHLNVSAEKNPQILFFKNLSKDYKNMDLILKYKDSEIDMTEAFLLTGAILKKNLHIWTGKLDTEILAKIKKIFSPIYEDISFWLKTVSQDNKHPLNVMLKPYIKMSLHEYVQELTMMLDELLEEAWTDIKAVFYSFQPLFHTVETLVLNSIFSVKQLMWNAYKLIRDKSAFVQAIDYIEAPKFLQNNSGKVSEALLKFIKQIFMKDGRFLQFQFSTGRILVMHSFIWRPYLDTENLYKYFQIPDNSEKLRLHYQPMPHSKYGMIFGPHHIYTFDGYLYKVPAYPHSSCFSLLAHDLQSSLFTVLSTEDSIHIIFNEMTIKINGNNEVFINGSTTASIPPIQADNGKVIISRGNNLQIWSPTLTVICSSRDFLCIFEMSSWHSRGTIGLLGNADGNPKNEFQLPDGKKTNLLDFVISNDVSTNLKCSEPTPNSEAEDRGAGNRICGKRMNSICPNFEPEHGSFLSACVNDVAAGLNACYTTSGLAALCYFKNERSFTDCNEKERTTVIGNKLEVVLIVQEHKSFIKSSKAKFTKGLESLCSSLDKQFKEKGYSSVLFSLVGYGGQTAHFPASVRSTEGNAWHPYPKIKQILQNLEFAGNTDADSLQSLKYVTEVLGYDAYHSKIFIIVSESDKQVKRKKSIEKVMRFLESNGITLYTVSSYPAFEKSQNVFGIRADGLIFSSAKTEEAHLDFPKGTLAKLTSATKGSVFLSKFLTENNPDLYFKEFSTEVWAKVHKEASKCRSCSTIQSEWWWYAKECSIVRC